MTQAALFRGSVPAAKHGAVMLRGSSWLIDCDGAVMIRLKRWLARIDKDALDQVRVRRSPEVDRDLQAFLDRYPMEMTPADVAELHRGAEIHREQERTVAKVLSGEYIARDFPLAIPLRDYQRVAADLWLTKGSLLLGDDTGIGKTLSAIGGLSDPSTLPALVVTPGGAVPMQWQDVIRAALPGVRTHILKGATAYDLVAATAREHRRNGQDGPATFPDVVISPYTRIHGWVEVMREHVKSVVYDEVQELRHADTLANPSRKWRAAHAISVAVDRRLGLSATPTVNYGGEFWNVGECLFPGALGDRAEFDREWCTREIERKRRIRDPRAFGLYLREQGLMLRRTRSDVGREMPPLTIAPTRIEANIEELDRIKGRAAELARVILAQGAGKGAGLDKMQKAGELDRLVRQATGIAKCLARGTRVIRFDGSVVPVENLRVGDVLMGPDSRPRRILATTSGEDDLFEVSPSSSSRAPFKPYVVNGNHVLALKHTGAVRHGDRFLFAPYMKGDHAEVAVHEYTTKSAHFRRMLKGYKAPGVAFPMRSVPVDPYFLGLWLGDGSSAHTSITTMDPEIRDYLHAFAAGNGLRIRVSEPNRTAPTYHLCGPRFCTSTRRGRSRNPLRTAIRALGVLNHKHIPRLYLVNDRRIRMALLAGLIDTDGHLNASGGYTIATKWAHLADEIRWLAQSLGFAASSHVIRARNQLGNEFVAHRVSIYGEGLESLPVRIARKRATARSGFKDALRFGIQVRPVGRGPYCGFQLDGDGLFLLEDFTVTHNSPFIADFVRWLVEQGEPVLVGLWHRSVYDLMEERLKDLAPAFYTGEESPKQKREALRRFKEKETPVLCMSLRSGAAIDGLQYVCRTVVIGELDWSHVIHHQLISRVDRDGQPDKVVAYYLLSDIGSDPIVADVCGAKRANSEPIRNPTATTIEGQTVDPDHVRRLAESYLKGRS